MQKSKPCALSTSEETEKQKEPLAEENYNYDYETIND